MKRRFIFSLIAVLALLAIIASALSALSTTMALAAVQPATVAVPSSVSLAPKSTALSDLESAYENIYTQVNPSVVLINVLIGASTNPQSGRRGIPQTGRVQQALGSGFMWDTEGDIVTNNHVIDGATQITVTFADGTTVPGKLVGADPDSDLAVVKVDVPTSQLHPVQVADSTKARVGQLAVAIGNPYGEQNTMTIGIISALGRSLPASGDTTQGQGASQGPAYTIPDVIQTDAPINPGNSGGVLLNSAGQVLGVTQSIESASGSSSGIGFAIPAAIVQQVIPALIKTGHYDHPYLGISGTSLLPGLAQAMGLPASQRGALIAQVTPNGPAAQAGLLGNTRPATVEGVQTQVGGDVITALDGQQIKGFDDLVAYLARYTQVNQTIKVTILRDGKSQDISVTLTARPSSS
ncbi:MAG: S1C family serine protease [Acidobacteriota bacterium]